MGSMLTKQAVLSPSGLDLDEAAMRTIVGACRATHAEQDEAEGLAKLTPTVLTIDRLR